MRTQCACNGSPAFFLRSAACFMLLYQAAFIAGELARGPLFCAALVQAFALGCALAMYGAALGGGGRFSAPCALAIMLAVPHAVRAAFALARVFAYMHAGAATAAASSAAAFLPFDALLLAYDRAAFVFVLPFYWFAITSYFALRSAKAVRRAAFADIVLFCLMFTVWKSGAISVYKWPVLKLFVFCAVLFLELLAISLATLARARQGAGALAPSGFGRGAARAERVSVCGLLVLLAVISGGALFKPLNERELESGGGLLQSKLFSFDFAPFLRLENEITMNDDLVFIVRKKSEAPAGRLDDDWLSGADFFSDLPDLYAIEDRHSLMRRFVLSAYDSKNGFTRSETVDERAQRRALPAAKMTRDAGPEKKRALLEQEYYMVNIDSEALIAISEPRQVALFERWNASSFKSAYKVESLTSEATRRDLAQAAFPAAGLGAAGLSAEDLAWYTAFADPKKGPGATEKRIQDLSLALSGHTENYWEKIQSLFLYLKYGDYLYSLKPGIAPDGDQLAYFLFDGKKGYCSYFAFAFASMLRSIGVPCRVAVGFYSDNSAERLGFYPVTANMAHAWVEVWFPEYGWIEYDPTTEQYAPDEQWSFGSPPPDELLERLMKEILDNHAALTEKAAPPPAAGRQTGTLREQAARMLGAFGPPVFFALLYLLLLYRRFALRLRLLWAKNPRKKACLLYAYAVRLLALSGRLPRAAPPVGGTPAGGTPAGGTPPRLDNPPFAGEALTALFENSQKARFAPAYTPADYAQAREAWECFSAAYRRAVPAVFRVVSCVFPPACAAAVWLYAARRRHTIALLTALLLAALPAGGARALDETPSRELDSAHELFRQAQEAQRGRYWEKAVELWTRGQQEHPQDSRFSESLGDLYFHRELYRLAKAEYLKTEKLKPDDTELLYKLAQTTGSLNEDKQAAGYLERLLGIKNDDRDGIALLGWMYFKLHRLIEGQALITDAIERLGPRKDFLMMLGTINSDLLRYADSAAAYDQAVAAALRDGDFDFAAVANYNYSILESRFYRYGAAAEKASASLDFANRASGHLALGELYLRRLDWKAGAAEYQTAYDLDKSPLSKLSLADAHRRSGRLEEARLYAEDCLKQTNNAWMLNYGIDTNQYKRDIHSILYPAYAGLARLERFTLHQSPLAKLRSLYRRARCRLLSAIHERLFYKYSLVSGNEFTSGGATNEKPLEALTQYRKAFDAYNGRGGVYLREAKEQELRIIQAAAASYTFEEGALFKKRALLEQALAVSDPVWEKDLQAEAYALLCGIDRRRRGLHAENLYALNAGALLQNGIRLPVRFEVSAAGHGTAGHGTAARQFQRLLKKTGFRAVPAPAAARYILRVRLEAPATDNAAAFLELYDTRRGFALIRDTLRAEAKTPAAARAALAQALSRRVFSVR